MKKTLKAILVMFAIITGGISQANPLDSGCNVVFDFNTGKYTKICCTPDGRCTVYTF
jgi:hypothetical protein